MLSVWMWGDSDIFITEIDSYFNDSYVFAQDKLPGLQVAFALVAYDGKFEM